MGKIQKIKRQNGTIISSVNIPCAIVEELKLEKGEELICQIVKFKNRRSVIFFREDEDGTN